MSGKTTFLFTFLLLFCGFFPLHSDSGQIIERTRQQMDSVLQQVRAKISYSWMRSNEYFHRMISSMEEKASAKIKGIQVQTDVQADEFKKKVRKSREDFYEKTRSLYQKQSESISDDVSEKTARVKEEIEEMGKKFYKNASQEVEKSVDNFQK